MCVSRGASNPIKNFIIDSTSDAVVVRKGNHPFKAVPGIQSQRNTLYPAWGIPLSFHLLERPIIIFRFSDHIGSVRTPCTLNLTKTMMNRHPHLPYCGDGCYPRYYYDCSLQMMLLCSRLFYSSGISPSPLQVGHFSLGNLHQFSPLTIASSSSFGSICQVVSVSSAVTLLCMWNALCFLIPVPLHSGHTIICGTLPQQGQL